MRNTFKEIYMYLIFSNLYHFIFQPYMISNYHTFGNEFTSTMETCFSVLWKYAFQYYGKSFPVLWKHAFQYYENVLSSTMET